MAHDAAYDRSWVADYFDRLGEGEWERMVANPVEEVSLHLHLDLLREHVPKGARVLEIGAGPGRFTKELAARGCSVVVTDVSPVQLDLHRRFASEHGFHGAVADRQLLDVCDMEPLADASFDAIVCYGGPLSYVFDRAPDALRECRRVVRPGGAVVASVMSLWGACHLHLPFVMTVPPAANEKITDSGDLLPVHWEGVTHRCHLFRSHEVRDLVAQAGLALEVLSASHALSTGWEETLAETRRDPAAWAELLRMEREACREPGCVDLGAHILFAARRPR